MSKDKHGQELRAGDIVRIEGTVKEVNDQTVNVRVEGQSSRISVVSSAVEKISEEEVQDAAYSGFHGRAPDKKPE